MILRREWGWLSEVFLGLLVKVQDLDMNLRNVMLLGSSLACVGAFKPSPCHRLGADGASSTKPSLVLHTSDEAS